MTEYKPKPVSHRGRVIVDRRRPFELFLKFGGGLFTVHFQCGRLIVMLEPSARARARARERGGARKKQ